jgi:hypothetical protein
MAINRLDGFTTLPKPNLDGTRENQAARERSGEGTIERPARADRKEAPTRDSVEISPKAHRLNALQQAVAQGLAALEELPEVRADRVAEVRSRLNRGFYNSVEVRNRVAERLEGGAHPLEDI